MEAKNILVGLGAVIAVALLASKGDEEDGENVEVGGGCCPEVGFAPSPNVELFTPADVLDWTEPTATIGHFYQVRRGDMLLGHGKKSLTWMALHAVGEHIALESGASEKEASKYGCVVADNANNRCDYVNLILASTWNDMLYGTWGYGRKDYPGCHGRSIPLSSCHADNRALMQEGNEPIRKIEVGSPEDKGTGSTVVNGLSRPLLWLPLINLDAILDGEITTRDMVWPGESRISGLEPPPQFWRHG